MQVLNLTRLPRASKISYFSDRLLASIATVEAKVPNKPVISIVDDDESVREGTMDLVNAMGFFAEAFESAEDFLKSDDLHVTSCLIADVRMTGMTGIELHNRLIELGHIIPTILVTAFPEDRDRARALQAGVICYLAKPFKDDDLLECVRSALEPREAGRRRS
jgi:FixJ family two-component response regulator